MKIAELLLESGRHKQDRYDLILMSAMNNPYGAAGTEFDAHYNPEIARNIEHEFKRYKKLGSNPVTLLPDDDHAEKMTNEPKKGTIQSAGYRGKEKALQRAGIRKANPLVTPPDFKTEKPLL